MGDPHHGLIEDLNRRLNTALNSGNDEEVKELLAEIGGAELNRKTLAKRIRVRPASARRDATQQRETSPQSM
jgi:hypothetical protein